MIAIIRLVTTQAGWSYNMMRRIERAYEELKPENVILYPNHPLDLGVHDFNPSQVSNVYKNNIDLTEIKHVKKIIFLEPLQDPYLRMIEAGLNTPFDVHIHSNPLYAVYDMKRKWAYVHEVSFPSMITQRQNTVDNIKNYSAYFAVSAVGGFLEKFNPIAFRRNNYILWAGYNVGNIRKGYQEFITLAINNPRYTFVACTDVAIPHEIKPNNVVNYVGLSAREFLEITKSCSYVLVTSKVDNFPYALYDAISVGLIPLVPDTVWFTDFPKKFRYTDNISLDIKVEEYELNEIVKDHFYLDTFKRIVQSRTLEKNRV